MKKQKKKEKKKMKVRIKKLSPEAVIPTYAKVGDAGMDMVATKIMNETLDSITTIIEEKQDV